MARLQVLLAAVCFGTTGTAQALGPDASPLTVGAVRIAVGALLLLAAQRAVARASAGAWPRGAVAAGALGVAAYQLCFFAAVKDTGVAIGTVVALGSAPALAGAGGWLLDRRAPGRAWAAATGLACLGVALLAFGGGGASEVSAPGVALALGAGASYAAFTLASKRLLDAGHAVEPVMARTFGLGAILLIPVLVLGDVGWAATPGGAAMALWLGAIPTAVAYLLFARGLRRLPANEVATLTLGEPVTAAVLGAVVLSERPGAAAIAGIGLILAGLAVLALPRRATHAPAPPAASASAPTPAPLA
jgi:DME family drug/metabolite transporter